MILLFPVPLLYSLLVKEIPATKFCILIGAIISLSIEAVQFVIDVVGHYPSHVADVDDFILNMVGVIAGAIVLYFIKEKGVYRSIKRKFREE